MATRSMTKMAAVPSPAANRRRKAVLAVKPAEVSATAAPRARAKAKAKAQPGSTGKPAREAKETKPDRPRKPKLVRDSFTIPKAEYAVLEDLKKRAARLGRPTKKSEMLRAGLMVLAGMADSPFLTSVTAVPTVKTGRPTKAA